MSVKARRRGVNGQWFEMFMSNTFFNSVVGWPIALPHDSSTNAMLALLPSILTLSIRHFYELLLSQLFQPSLGEVADIVSFETIGS